MMPIIVHVHATMFAYHMYIDRANETSGHSQKCRTPNINVIGIAVHARNSCAATSGNPFFSETRAATGARVAVDRGTDAIKDLL